MSFPADSPFHQLHQRLVSSGKAAVSWDNMFTARRRTVETLEQLVKALPPSLSKEDVSVVLSGSLGRGDFTKGSDIDWNLLLDGAADRRHFDVSQDVSRAIKEFAAKEPGREGTFGGLVVSHDLIHLIGGEEDTNANLTRRVLLLLESIPIGPSIAFDRTFRSVLERYLVEDEGFWSGTTQHKHHVPHFLLNDLTRFWRTMAVDFAYKRRNRQGKGRVIRNLKLRMSRKMLFVAGLLACFRCQIDFASDEERYVMYSTGEKGPLLAHVESIFRLAPSDLIASLVLREPHLEAPAIRLFEAYDVFLEMLADPETRAHLDSDPAADDPISVKAFDASREFREALLEIFFDEPSGLGELTRRYGIF